MAQPTTQPAATETPKEPEGFFRPADDPSLTHPPLTGLVAPAPAGYVEALEAERRAREAAERELDRAYREHVEARSAPPPTRPMIVSPLDGNAPVVSPLDGTARIISPIGR
jgi:hypothetical protein